jgi:hypothetical protein
MGEERKGGGGTGREREGRGGKDKEQQCSGGNKQCLGLWMECEHLHRVPRCQRTILKILQFSSDNELENDQNEHDQNVIELSETLFDQGSSQCMTSSDGGEH